MVVWGVKDAICSLRCLAIDAVILQLQKGCCLSCSYQDDNELSDIAVVQQLWENSRYVKMLPADA